MSNECLTYTKVLTISSKKRFELIHITDEVIKAVRESGIKNGLVLVFVPHATAAVIANEYEHNIVQDYIEWVRRYVPQEGGWRHNMIDDNAHAHIASAIIGPSRTFPIVNGEVIRGTWQEIMVFELDGPRYRRKVVIQVVGCK